MLKGLAITPPVLGRIAIGKVIEKKGKRLPEKDDQFTLTSQVQHDGQWLLHPLDKTLRTEAGDKLRSIPVRLLFNDPDLNFRAQYALFDRTSGRPLCVGDGEHCKRRCNEGIKALPCPSPDGCPLAQGGACKPYGRLNVLIGDDDPLGSFIFRTTGFNSIRTLAARLAYFKAISGNRLACMPLELRLRGKSTRQSRGTAIYYVDITLREGWTLEATLAEAQRLDEFHHSTGFDQKALDKAAKAGFANGAFEDSAEDSADVVEEFYPDAPEHPPGRQDANAPVTLTDKLQAKSQQGKPEPSEPESTDQDAAPPVDHPPQTSSRQAKRA